MKVSTAHLSSILSGRNDRKYPCSPESARRAARHLGIDARWLVVGDARYAPSCVDGAFADISMVLTTIGKVGEAIERAIEKIPEPPDWIFRRLFQFGLPHPDVDADHWVRAMRWLISEPLTNKDKAFYFVSDLLNSRSSLNSFKMAYEFIVRRLAAPITVTLPGHAWVAVQKATWRVYMSTIATQTGNFAREMSQIPSLRQDKFE